MRSLRFLLAGTLMTSASLCMGAMAFAAERWHEATFPPPNGGRLVFIILSDGNPACASYDGRNCLWGQSLGDIDFARVKPLACGAAHRALYGVTGFEDPHHWCNLALRAQATPAPAAAPYRPAAAYRLTGWSGWGRAAGVEYRYRVGWNPANGGSGKTVDVIYEVRNRGPRQWAGAARSLNCDQPTLFGGTDVALAPGQTKEVRVRAPNCGSATNPDIRPNVVRSGKID